VLRDAIAATFKRRGTEFPATLPVALTEAFAKDEAKRRQWQAFCKRSGVAEKVGGLEDVVAELAAFLSPPLAAAAVGREFPLSWEAGGPWKTPTGQA
jgi:hypothetical protein